MGACRFVAHLATNLLLHIAPKPEKLEDYKILSFVKASLLVSHNFEAPLEMKLGVVLLAAWSPRRRRRITLYYIDRDTSPNLGGRNSRKHSTWASVSSAASDAATKDLADIQDGLDEWGLNFFELGERAVAHILESYGEVVLVPMCHICWGS